MKKVVYNLLVVVALLYFSSVGIAEAHPGRIDGNGGHTCRTNCASWGLGEGEYHYHGGGGSSSTGQSTDTAPVSQEFLEHRSAVLSATPTKKPTKIPTKISTPTPTVAASPTVAATPTIEPTKKVQPLKASVKPQKQNGFFDWLFSVLGLDRQ
jgi:hypothetical protein